MIGKVYAIPPQPPVAENTHWVDAGALMIGVEYRDVDPENLRATYEGTEFLERMEESSPAGGFSDEGVSIHVSDAADGHEYLRFDVFDAEPHYHYIHKTAPGEEPVNNIIDFDVVAHGEMLPWAIHCLRERLPAMLSEAGGAHLVDQLEPDVLGPAIDMVAGRAARAQDAFRSMR